jgi:Zn-dependent protease with chaperone function
MEILGLLLALVLIAAGGARLGVNLSTASVSWFDVVFHLVVAALAVGLVDAVGRNIDARFARKVDELVAGGPVEGVGRGALRSFGLLMVTLVPLLAYLLSLALAATLGIGFFAVWVMAEMPRLPLFLPLVLILVVGGTFLATLFAVYHLLFPPRSELSGHPIARDKHPRLWQLSREIASELGTRPIDRIALQIEPGLGVYQEGGFLTNVLGRGKRVLQIGLPSLHDLTVPEFTAILVHEYGHFSHGDTRWGMMRYYLGNALYAALGSMPGPSDGLTGAVMAVNPGYWILQMYASLFHRVTSSSSRLQEVMADMRAIRRCGGDAFREGLMKVAMSGPVFAEAVGRYYQAELNTGKPPVTDPAALMRLVYEKSAPATLKKMRTDLLDLASTSPYDSHPPLQTRLDYAAAAPNVAEASAEPVAALFDEWEGINAYVMDDFNQELLGQARGRIWTPSG